MARKHDKPTSHIASLYRPQLATLVKEPPQGDGWLHDRKLDGWRLGAVIRDGKVWLISRNGHDWTTEFPTVVSALTPLKLDDAILDGEVCAVLPDGRTSFSAMQNFRSGATLIYYVFDALRLDGEDLRALPLETRKQRLAARIDGRKKSERVQYVDHVVGHGETVLREACKLGMEGIVSKQRRAPYVEGRSTAWLKVKCNKRQEFVVGGWSEPDAPGRKHLGALLLGYYDEEKRLVFAGKVGTGFTERIARDLRTRLEKLAAATNPFAANGPDKAIARTAHWVTPKLIAEVAFTEFTGEGHVRHPSFQGLREDKEAKDVTREEPLVATKPAKKTRASAENGESVIASIQVTHPDRILFPALGLTKLDIVRYYDAVADAMLPHLRGRPLTLKQCAPDADHCRYLRHSHARAPSQVRVVNIREQKKVGDYMIIDDRAGLIALAQRNIVEFHTWNSTADRLERPDRVILDLDPGPKVPWSEMVKAARLVRATLQHIGLESWVKTTGGKGLHIVIPIVPAHDWSVCLEFARSVAATLVEHDPARYTMKFSKSGREQQILIDYLRNNRTNTAVAAFSVRARETAAVSTPLRWDELTPRLDPARFTVRTVPRRLKTMTDPWADYFRAKQKLRV